MAGKLWKAEGKREEERRALMVGRCRLMGERNLFCAGEGSTEKHESSKAESATAGVTEVQKGGLLVQIGPLRRRSVLHRVRK